MKDQGLVSVHIGPTNKSRNISGPVAILMQTDTHFLGAYVGSADTLVMELLPKAFIGTTAWIRGYPAAVKLLQMVEKLDEGSVIQPTQPERHEFVGEGGPPSSGATRYYGTGAYSRPDLRRTTITEDLPLTPPPKTDSIVGKMVLDDIRSLTSVTKDKLDQVVAGDKKDDGKKS